MKAKTSQNFQVIGLVGRAKSVRHKDFLLKVKTYLEKRKLTLMWDEHLAEVYGDQHLAERAKMLKEADMLISLGGDGTLLKIVRDLNKRKDLYIYGVNLGNVGFFTEDAKGPRVFETLDEFFDGKYIIDDRLILRATVYRKGKKICTHLALNDVVINQGNFARLIQLRAEIDQRKMIEFKADGVIVSSPTGSTGHNLSAGGPIVHPKIDSMIFTPICPAELSVRPIVVPHNRQINLHIQTERRFKDNQIGLTIDGQIVVPLEYDDDIKVRKSSRRLRFIRRAGGSTKYYRLLRDKLSWGKRG